MALFEQQGYDATSVEDIVAAANVSPSTVFRYFITKEDIVLTGEPKMVYVRTQLANGSLSLCVTSVSTFFAIWQARIVQNWFSACS